MSGRARRLVGGIALALACAAGCARHVVLPPEDVPRYDDSDWKVISEPAPQPAKPDSPRR